METTSDRQGTKAPVALKAPGLLCVSWEQIAEANKEPIELLAGKPGQSILVQLTENGIVATYGTADIKIEAA